MDPRDVWRWVTLVANICERIYHIYEHCIDLVGELVQLHVRLPSLYPPFYILTE